MDPNGLYSAFDLASVCDKTYNCKKCCDAGVMGYDEKAIKRCRIEASTLSIRYHTGIIHYWEEIAPNYTYCNEYAEYIKYKMSPAKGLRYFTLLIGANEKSYPIIGVIRSWFVGVFHLCNPALHPGIYRKGPFSSDAALDPWAWGLFPVYNKWYGNPLVQPGRGSMFDWL